MGATPVHAFESHGALPPRFVGPEPARCHAPPPPPTAPPRPSATLGCLCSHFCISCVATLIYPCSHLGTDPGRVCRLNRAGSLPGRGRDWHILVPGIPLISQLLLSGTLAATAHLFSRISGTGPGWNPYQWTRFVPESFRWIFPRIHLWLLSGARVRGLHLGFWLCADFRVGIKENCRKISQLCYVRLGIHDRW